MGSAAKRRADGKQRGKSPSKSNERSSAVPLGLIALQLLQAWKKSSRAGLLFLAESESRAERLGAIVYSLDSSCEVLVFPRLNTLPFEHLEPSREIAGRRSSVLRRLAERSKPILLLSTAEAVMQRLPPPSSWQRKSLRLHVGDAISDEDISQRLESFGYDLGDTPDYPGGAMINGQTLEVFPAGALCPFRIQHSGGVIRSIRCFDRVRETPGTEIQELILDPMSETLVSGAPEEKSASIFDYYPGAKLIGDEAVARRAKSWLETIDEAASQGGAAQTYLAEGEWAELTGRTIALPASIPYSPTPTFSVQADPKKVLRAFLNESHRRGARLMFVAAREDDLRAMERLAGRKVQRFANWKDAVGCRKNGAAVLADFDSGFVLQRSRLAVVTASDVLGSRAHHLQPMARAWDSALDSSDLPTLGAVVLHLQRGLAILGGLQTISPPGMPAREMVRLVFAGDEAVLLAPAELAMVWPYASEPSEIALDKADGSSWLSRRDEADQQIQLTAKQISGLVRQRQQKRAPKLIPPQPIYERFVSRFPYVPTVDQSSAIEDVLGDLASGHPMDRVICGDVGFGKTEIALRAAAAVVFAGKQVAVAVPTTVLARQHLATFRKRFAPFGVEVGNVSSLAGASELREVKESLKNGSLKLVIGTQALAAKTVEFSKLGLVIIDEEQHFGAAEKQKLSAIGEDVHTLWMSATPIPRTLAASAVGLRQLSVIASPPIQRAPIMTKISSLAEATILAALRREQRRGGQSFLICPRIKDLAPMFERLRSAAPELGIICIHGKLPVHEIDDRMMTFVEGRADVLLATNIVESGLDIPRANTIVVCWPEKFGLAQLHQLRGRVGRGGIRGLAYFLTDSQSSRSGKRLEIIAELNQPGAGFAISARDLDLRGAGDLLASQQSGHVKVFGPALYSHLLRLAIAGNSSGLGDMWVPELNIPSSDFLPDNYLRADAVRLEIYAKAARCRSESELDDLTEQTRRRFGELPSEGVGFFAAAKLRVKCRQCGVVRLDAGPDGVAASVLPERKLKARSRRLHRNGDRVIYRPNSHEGVPDLFEFLDFFCTDAR